MKSTVTDTRVLPTFSDAVPGMLRGAFPGAHAAKRIAGVCQASTRTVQTWLQGRNQPSLEDMIELMAESQAIAEQINELVRQRRAARGEDVCG